ncbi:hypothetical protein C8J57DRAFT_1705860 [Mycena rebaudengoi]|nr:hypothetical protein C8J57DRAFT_1705860 [Mycena rebaudengoi]
MVYLRPELVDAIVNKVTDGSTLKSVSLVCRSLLPLSQHHIFEWMSLSDPETSTRALALLSSSPHLSVYVRNLTIRISDVETATMACLDPEALLIPLFRNVECLRISAIRELWQWHHTSYEGLRVVVEDCMFQPTVKQPYFEDSRMMSVPETIICQVLASCRLLSPRNVLPNPVHANAAEYSSLPSCPLPRLRRLEADVQPGLHFEAVMVASRFTLQYLSFQFSPGYSRYSHEISPNLPHLPALRFLEFSFATDTPALPDKLISTLCALPHRTPVLEVLSVVIVDGSTDASTAVYSALNHTLPQLPRFRELRFSLSFFSSTSSVNPAYKASVAHVSEQLPFARDTGLLTFFSDPLSPPDKHF